MQPKKQPIKLRLKKPKHLSDMPTLPDNPKIKPHIGFLTEQQFLAHFPPLNITREQLRQHMKVMYSTPQTLDQLFNMTPPTTRRKPIIKSTEDKRYQNKERIVDYFYEILVTGRYKYLALFFNAYFNFKSPLDLKWSGTDLQLSDDSISVQKNDSSRRLIRNLFYLELLDLTTVTNSVKSQVSFWRSLVNLYNRLELEDRFFAPSCIDLFLRDKKTKREQLSGIKEINHHNLFYQFQAYQPKASIFNPYSIMWTIDNVLGKQHLKRAPTRIFTPVLSWCSYLVAYMHIKSMSHYVGVDVMPTACKKAEFLADYYDQLEPKKFAQKKVDIYCTPSEKLAKDKRFLAKYRQFFDTIIVCPPYFDMEIYHEGEQSINTFPSYEAWLDGYWRATAELCFKVAQTGAVFAVIANDYNSTDKKVNRPLTTDLDKITQQCGWTHRKTYYLQNRTSPLRSAGKDRTERMFVYLREN